MISIANIQVPEPITPRGQSAGGVLAAILIGLILAAGAFLLIRATYGKEAELWRSIAASSDRQLAAVIDGLAQNAKSPAQREKLAGLIARIQLEQSLEPRP